MLRSSANRDARPFPGGASVAAAGGALLVAVLVAIIYWPARNNGFVWDDWVPLVDDPLFRDPARWWEALTAPPLKDPVALRPVAMLTYMLQLWAGQTTPAPFHIANVLIHAASTFLLVLVCWRALREATSLRTAVVAAAAAGLVYGLHPALTEPVIWISCRYDLLMTFFLLLAMVFDRFLPPASYARAAAVGLAFLAAAFSKETAVGFVIALPFMHVAFGRLDATLPSRSAAIAALTAHGKVYGALLCACLVYVVARTAISGPSLGMGRMAVQFHDVPGVGQHLLAVAASLGRHAIDALWPFTSGIPSRSLILPLAFVDAWPIIPALFGVCIVAVASRRAGMNGRVLFALVLAFVAALLPVSNLVPLPGLLGELWVASRYLAFPLVFLCLAAPFAFCIAEKWLARHVSRPRWLLWAIAILWIGASAAYVRATIPLWKDDGALNYWAIENGARNYWRYQNLGDHYLRVGKSELARGAFIAAVKLRADVALNWAYLGMAEANLGHTEQARNAFRKALELDPNLIKARLNLAKLEMWEGNAELAAGLLEAGAARLAQVDDPSEIGALHYLLGIAYTMLGKNDAAAVQLRTALEQARDANERAAAEKALRAIAPK